MQIIFITLHSARTLSKNRTLHIQFAKSQFSREQDSLFTILYFAIIQINPWNMYMWHLKADVLYFQLGVGQQWPQVVGIENSTTGKVKKYLLDKLVSLTDF